MEYGVRKPFEGMTTFYAAGKVRPSETFAAGNEVPMADVHLVRGGHIPTLVNGDYWNPRTYGSRGAYDEYRGGAYQGQLFKDHPSKISGAFADPSMRAAVPTLLGMALNEGRRLGTGVQADDSLSKHSSPLAKRGLKAGVLVPNPANPRGKVTNGISFETHAAQIGQAASLEEAVRHGMLVDNMTPASPEQVEAGRRTVRSMLRPEKATPAPKPTAAQRRVNAWHEAYEANPDRPNTAGVGQRSSELDLGHRFSPHAQAVQHAWLDRHYAAPEPEMSNATRLRMQYEIDTRHGMRQTVNEGKDMSRADIAARRAALRTPAEDPRSPSQAEWQDNGLKPTKGQRKLF